MTHTYIFLFLGMLLFTCIVIYMYHWHARVLSSHISFVLRILDVLRFWRTCVLLLVCSSMSPSMSIGRCETTCWIRALAQPTFF
jgi:hypothetical protein